MNKKEFETILGRQICDQTWYRATAKLRKYGIHKENKIVYSEALEQLAVLSKHTKKRLKVNHFLYCWKMINNNNNQIADYIVGYELRKIILDSMEEVPSNSVFYKWFTSAGIPFRENSVYEKRDFLQVLYSAFTWQYRNAKPTISIQTLKPLKVGLPTITSYVKRIQSRLKRKGIGLKSSEIREFYISLLGENSTPTSEEIDSVYTKLLAIG